MQVWLAKQVTRKQGLSRRHILHFVEKMTFFSNFSTQYSSCMGLPCKKVQFVVQLVMQQNWTGVKFQKGLAGSCCVPQTNLLSLSDKSP